MFRVLNALLLAGLAVGQYVPTQPKQDNSTWSNINEIQTTHYFIDWYVDFELETLAGSIIHDFTAQALTNVIQLDIAQGILVDKIVQVPANAAINATNNNG